MIAKLRTSRPVTQERLLEVRPKLFRFGHNGLAPSAQEHGVQRVELDDAIDVGVRKGLGPLLHDLKRFLFRPGDVVGLDDGTL
jgi:hypothetical protein